MLRVVVLLVAAALLVGVEVGFHTLSSLAHALDPSRLEAWIRGAGAFAPVLFIGVMALGVISPLPTVPLDLLAGRVFGPIAGTFYSLFGATLGSLVSFRVARWLGREFLERFLRGHINFCRRCSDRLMSKVVFFGRLIPGAPFDLVSYGAGLTRMSPLKFAAASFLGMLPLTYVYNAAGDLVFRSRWIGWVGGSIMLALFFVLPWWIERYDLFSMRQHFRHPEDGEAGGESDRVTKE